MSITNNDLPLNSQKIKGALKSTGFNFYDYDIKSNETKKTSQIKKEIIKESGNEEKCAICGREKLRIEAAHIEPLEAGALTTKENIILLCSNSINSVTPGCHELFDEGLTSIKLIEKLKNSTDSYENGSIREKMMELWKETKTDKNTQNPLQQLISKKHWGKALYSLKEQKKCTPNGINFSIIIKEAEINRKRTAKGGLKQARKLLDSIGKIIPKLFHSQFCYELGYVHLLSGEHDLALKQFELSQKKENDNIKKTATFWLWLNAEIALKGNQSRWDIVQKKMDEIFKNKNQTNSIFSKRIHANGLFNIVRVFLIKKEFEKAKDRLDEAIEHWKEMDITTGWEKSFIPTILSLRGQVLVSLKDTESDINKALKLFSRYLVIMLAGKQVPEGIRDVLFPVAECLRKIGNKKIADNVEEIAKRILDGASFKFPYKKTGSSIS